MSAIEVFRNDRKAINLNFTDGDGQPIDITGWTVYFTVRIRTTLRGLTETSTDADAVIAKTQTSHISPSEGQTQIILSKDDTNIDDRNYQYDVQTKSGTGVITTIISDEFIVKPDVTRAT